MSESVKVRCPGCQTKLRMKGAEVFGRKIRCPQCSQTFRVNAPQESPPAKAVQASATPARPKKPAAPPKKKLSDDEFLDTLIGFRETEEVEEALPVSEYEQDLITERRREEARAARAAAPPKTKKKKKRREPVDSDTLRYFMWFGAATVGGLVGAALWAALVYSTQREFAFAACFIGGLVGFAVMIVRNDDGTGPGIVAGIAAFLSILAGKFAVALLIANLVAQAIGEPDLDTEALVIGRIADEVMAEWQKEGRKLEMPDADMGQIDVEDVGPGKHLYPAGVWTEAEKRWNAKTPEQQKAFEQTVMAELEMVEDLGGVGKGLMTIFIFFATFGWQDIIWFSLAVLTAYKVAIWSPDG